VTENRPNTDAIAWEALTPQEGLVLVKLGDAWNDFVNLSVCHPEELAEFRHAIHAAQAIVMARACVRGRR